MSATNRALLALGLVTAGMIGLTILGRRLADGPAWTRPVVLTVFAVSLATLLGGVVLASTLRRGG
jgi:hypothetical protein